MQDITMADGETTKGDISSTGANGNSKALPTGIVPANKASTAPSQEIIDRYAPGSAPHWVGAASNAKEGGAGGEKGKS